MQTAVDLANKNPDLRGDFSSKVKSSFKTQGEFDYVTKYSGMSNEEMASEVAEGNLVP